MLRRAERQMGWTLTEPLSYHRAGNRKTSPAAKNTVMNRDRQCACKPGVTKKAPPCLDHQAWV